MIFRIKSKRLAELAAETGEIFKTEKDPAEKISVRFFYPFKKAERERKATNAGGVYYDKFQF